jgi:hypothetical protein
MQPDLARIAFVSRRFRDLHGLHPATLGMAMLTWGTAWTFVADGFRDPFIHVLLPAELTVVALSSRVNRYYGMTFGRIAQATSPRWGTAASAWSAGGTGFKAVFVGLVADLLKGLHSPGGPSCCAIALMLSSLLVVVRDGRHRLHHLAGVAAGLAALLATAGLPPGSGATFQVDSHIASQYVFAYLVIGVGLVCVGLFDHWVLARAMSRPQSARVAPAYDLARARTALAGTCLAGVVACAASAGWPTTSATIFMVLFLAFNFLIIVEAISEVRRGLAAHAVAHSDLTRRREARLLAQMAAMRGEVSAPAEAPSEPSEAPAPPDAVGHLALPILTAFGALIDVGLRGSGAPSLLALALAASHLRIGIRDWPLRKHYLLGTLAAGVSSVQYMFVGEVPPLDWAIWFLILMSSAMVVEGVLDTRVGKRLNQA